MAETRSAFEESGNLRGRPRFRFIGTSYNSGRDVRVESIFSCGVDFADKDVIRVQGVDSPVGRLGLRFVDGVPAAFFPFPLVHGPRFLFTGTAELSELEESTQVFFFLVLLDAFLRLVEDREVASLFLVFRTTGLPASSSSSLVKFPISSTSSETSIFSSGPTCAALFKVRNR